MFTSPKRVLLGCSVLPLLALSSLPQAAVAQSITPAPDGIGTIIHYDGKTYHIGGGTQAGANLFHSFQEFGLSPNEIANFLSNPQIQNVVGRVIGGNPSVIEGLIKLTGGSSNLYLMNPAGWVFTNGASLDVPGSFGVTTANRIGLGSGFFNAVGTNDFASLSGSLTSLLFDTIQPGAILNAADLSVENGSLWMVGGSVINTGTLSTPNGTITLAAVPGTSQVKLSAEGMTLSLLLDAVPAGEITPNTPLGLKPEDLPRYLTGGSHVGNATRVELGADGKLYLVGSAMRLEQGNVVIAGEIAADAVQLMAAGSVTPTDPSLIQGNDVTVVRYPEAGGTNTLSVIDARADDPQALLYGGAAGTIAKIINRDENGIEAIAEELAGIAAEGGKVDAVSITAEGNEGNFWLGNTWITDESVEDYGAQLVAWREALTESADLLLYSCFTALGATGDALMASLASLTGADVAASTNATGSANYGGDWVLESSTGNIETLTPFSDLTLSVWDGKLATRTVTSSADTNTSGTLRFEIGAATAGDTILFDSARTVNLTSGITWGQANLTIDGSGSMVQGNNTFRIFESTATTGTTTIQNLTISRGSTTGGGGGMLSRGAVTLINSTVSGNSANRGGGGGGGIFSDGAVTLIRSMVSDNSANYVGGGIIVSAGAGDAVTLINSTVSDNVTNHVGGGGGIHSNVPVTLSNSTVSGNSAVGRAGGIMSGGPITLTNSTVSGNSAGGHGGGIFGNGAVVTLSNSTVSGNSASGNGGGIYTTSYVMLTNSTIARNSTTTSGGGMLAFRGTISNTIIANNSAPTSPDIGPLPFGLTPIFEINNSLITSTAGMETRATLGIPSNGVNGNIIGVDPQLAPLANNGGPTQTHALLPGSPAIDWGNNRLAPSIRNSGDQRGFIPGIFNGTVDIGAYETGAVELNPKLIPAPPAPPVAAPWGLDLANIRWIWLDRIEQRHQFSILERACALIPELGLELNENGEQANGEALTAAEAHAKLSNHCFPM